MTTRPTANHPGEVAPRAAATVEQALLTRRSTRAFLPTPVPRAEVQRLLTLASRSASNSNCQPWQVHVLTGRPKRQLTEALWDALDDDRTATDPRYPYQPAPDDWPEPFRSRRADFGAGLYRDTLGLHPSDEDGRQAHHRRNYDFFGAPVGLILTVSEQPRASALVDAGQFLQAFMLLAREAGLDTCAQASFLDYEPVLRKKLFIDPDQIVICGISLGFADVGHPLADHRTDREPLREFVTFHEDSHS